jgi:hypothetical protein
MFLREKNITSFECDEDIIEKIIINYETMNEYIQNYKQLLYFFSYLPLAADYVKKIEMYIQNLLELFYNITKNDYKSNKDTINKCLVEILFDIVKYSSIICYIIYKKENIFFNKDKAKIELIYDILKYNIIIDYCIINKNRETVDITNSKKKFITTYFENFPININNDTTLLLSYLDITDFQKYIELLKSIVDKPELLDIYTYDYDLHTNIKENMGTIISYITNNLFTDLYLFINIYITDINIDVNKQDLYNNIAELASNLKKYENDNKKDEKLKKKLISHLIWYIKLILNINLLLYYNNKYSDIVRNIEYNNIFYAILNYLINNIENEIPFLLKKNKETSLKKLTNEEFNIYIFDKNFILKIEIIKLKTKKEGDNPEKFTKDIAKIKNDIEEKLFNELKENYIQKDQIITKAKTNITLLKNYEKHKSNQITTEDINKFKSTKDKITFIYNNNQYTRVIYINDNKKYVKINKTYVLLSKLKKV